MSPPRYTAEDYARAAEESARQKPEEEARAARHAARMKRAVERLDSSDLAQVREQLVNEVKQDVALWAAYDKRGVYGVTYERVLGFVVAMWLHTNRPGWADDLL